MLRQKDKPERPDISNAKILMTTSMLFLVCTVHSVGVPVFLRAQRTRHLQFCKDFEQESNITVMNWIFYFIALLGKGSLPPHLITMTTEEKKKK